MKCRICKAAEKYQSVKAPHVFGGQEIHNFWRCEKCDAIYLYPPLSETEEKYFYRKEFEKYMSTRVGDHRDWSNAKKHIESNQDQVVRRWQFIERHIADNIDVLEIGCSSGFMLDKFKDSNCHVVGVEPSGEFLEFVKNNGHTAYESLDEVKGKFDLICHFFVFEHIANPFKFIQDQLNLLKDGGVIVAEIPSASDPLTSLYQIDAFEKFYWSIAHHYYYTPKSLRYILEKMNLTYELIPEQRYDLSNHITWMTDGKPGGQGRFDDIFSTNLIQQYQKDLKDSWRCDTIFLKIYKV